ncbi:ankyrin repeat-containing protein NPR4 [Citrus clementina]|uniref:ankyrin repeat-containing protein NPR4 n=1 Tax=Citrus clementina TaxID=85681 RepID=UPI000CED1D25|nr:ankyrin repeat-containing protein NPR4 [Citrus x clementina]
MREASSKALRSALINYNVSPFLLSEIENQDMSETFKTITSLSGNTLLHIAAAGFIHDRENMATTLARKYPFLITMQNSKGDTPLHVAARAGMLQTAKILVDCAKRMTSSSQIDVKFLMEMKNVRGNTALHEALNALQDAKKDKNKPKEDGVTSLDSLARCLVSEDPNASYLMNVDCKSPLYLAVESKNEDILEYILEALPVNDDCATKLEGKSPVKVAIELQKLGLLKMMHEKQPALLLIKDEQKNTPMHWAASVDHLEGVRFLYEINPDSVLQRNEEGFYPFHLASENGGVLVMGEFFEKKKMPQPTDLFNKKGQNILHVAAMKGKFDSARRILKARDIDRLINEMDNDGNTPLHLAALCGRHLAVASLILDGRAKSDIINRNGKTAYDIVEKLSAEINPEFSGEDDDAKLQIRVDNYKTTDKNTKDSESKPNVYDTVEFHIKVENYKTTDKSTKDSESKPNVYDTMMTLSLLFIVYHYHQLRSPAFLRNLLRLIENLYKTSKQSSVNRNDLSNRITNLIVVATLIAGASFAASVQMGSSSGSETATTNTTASISIHGAGAIPFALARSNGHDGDDGSQKKKQDVRPSLKAFTVFNTIAMYTSITAAIVLCWAQLLDTNLASIDVWTASLLIMIALYASCIAFFASIYMLNDTGEAFVIAITGCFLGKRSWRALDAYSGDHGKVDKGNYSLWEYTLEYT